MANEVGDAAEVERNVADLRVVARDAAERAQEVLSIFEDEHPDDRRPRAAVDAATFAEGAERTSLQRTTALAAHEAARHASTDAAREAARATGDATAAAYLHPIARSTQVTHILGSATHAARAAELAAGDDRAVGDRRIAEAGRRATGDGRRATPALVTVLLRYPPAPVRGNRVAMLLSALDTSLRNR